MPDPCPDVEPQECPEVPELPEVAPCEDQAEDPDSGSEIDYQQKYFDLKEFNYDLYLG